LLKKIEREREKGLAFGDELLSSAPMQAMVMVFTSNECDYSPVNVFVCGGCTEKWENCVMA